MSHGSVETGIMEVETTEPKTNKAAKASGKKRKAKNDEPSEIIETKVAPKKAKEPRTTEEPAETKAAAPRPSKEAKKILDGGGTKEDALLSLVMVHHIRGTTAVTFEKLYTELGYRPKNKAMEAAWKEVKEAGFVEEATTKGKKKHYQLTQKGIDHAATDEHKLELANPPKTQDELHARIKEKAVNKHGVKIFELLLTEGSMSGTELAAKLGVDKDGHGFFYGFQQLKKMGYAEPDPETKGRDKKFRLSSKCFIVDDTCEADESKKKAED
jgi:DNA-binding PadR family transcriptional regulator